ncbi:DNA polymerase III subunit alpha [subsurface metagenome]
MIKAGCFDSICENRHSLLSSIQKAIDHAKRKGKGKMQSLFIEEDQELIPAEPFDIEEKLRYEQEAMGFFFSNHPLTQYKNFSGAFFTPSSRIRDLPNNKLVICGGTITKVEKKTSRKNQRWAKLTVEDLDGAYIILVFPDLFKDIGNTIDSLQTIAVKGRISDNKRTSLPEIFAEKIIPLSELKDLESHIKAAFLILHLSQLEEEDLHGIKKVLLDYTGKLPVKLLCRKKDEEIRLSSRDIKVELNEEMIEKITQIVGEGNIRFTI